MQRSIGVPFRLLQLGLRDAEDAGIAAKPEAAVVISDDRADRGIGYALIRCPGDDVTIADMAEAAALHPHPHAAVTIRIQAHHVIAVQAVGGRECRSLATEDALGAVAIQTNPERAVGRLGE